jgi:hypothetical protein
MYRKPIVIALIMVLVFILSATCLAAEKPDDTQQFIDKYFAGRTLDPIEGIWYNDPSCILAIVRTSAFKPQDSEYNSYDYLGIIIKRNYRKFGDIFWKLSKTESNFCFYSYRNLNGYWKLLDKNTLLFDGDSHYNAFPETYVRTYPAP